MTYITPFSSSFIYKDVLFHQHFCEVCKIGTSLLYTRDIFTGFKEALSGN